MGGEDSHRSPRNMDHCALLKSKTLYLTIILLSLWSHDTHAQSEVIIFDNYVPLLPINEELPPGTSLYNFTAHYTAGTIQRDGIFSLRSENGDHEYFAINSTDGELTNLVVFDWDTHPKTRPFLFTLQIVYTTPSNTTLSLPLRISIVDINDNTPQFISRVFNLSVYEVTPSNTIFGNVSATDPDSIQIVQDIDYEGETILGQRYEVENGRIIYDIVEGNSEGHFFINADTGEVSISSGATLNYDIINFYNLTVRARDGDNQSDYSQLIIHVLDSNNHQPVILGPFNVSWTISEYTSPNFTIIDGINVTDDDHGINAEVRFSIINGDPTGMFEIDEKTGRIVTGQLDREVASHITLIIAAIDQGEPPLSDTVTVSIVLVDVNDSPPKFTKDIYQASVRESIDRVGTSVITVTAVDPDEGPNGDVIYFYNGSDPFSIDNITGLITTSVILDREKVPYYLLTVGAHDYGGNGTSLTSFATVNVTVEDINDNIPYFNVSYFTADVLDNATTGEMVTTLTALDNDAGINAQVRWQVLLGETVTFSLEAATGIVRVNGPLSYQDQSQFNFTVIATDMGTPPFPSLEIQLYITVHDVNEKRPRFRPRRHNITLSESIPDGTNVLTVSARDKDDGLIGRVRYRIVTEFDEAGYFKVDPVSGNITAFQLDYDFRSIIQFQIEAYDGGYPIPFTDTANVTVHLLDINDNPPSFTFDPNNFTFSLLENSPPGVVIANLTEYIMDPDTGEGGLFNFSLNAGGFIVLPQIEIEENPEIIFWMDFLNLFCNFTSVNETLDSVLDQVTPIWNGSREIWNETNIFLNDLNEFLNQQNFSLNFNFSSSMPEFENLTRNDSITDSTIIEAICTIPFHSLISEVEIGPRYLIHFELDTQTGILTSGRSFDRESEPLPKIEIMLRDFGDPSLTSYVNITIAILDRNDHNPYFPSNVSGTIIEFNSVGELIVAIEADDEDVGENARFTYAIYSGNDEERFGIIPHNGTVFAAEVLNKTVQKYYQLGIMAVDHGEPARYTQDLGYVNIEVLDFNDNAPSFIESTLFAQLPENRPAGTVFHHINVTDSDVGSNSILRFSILESEYSYQFIIDPISGFLTSNETFDAENVTNVTIVIVAVDMGVIPLSSSAELTVNIIDVNDNPPFFPEAVYKASAVENSPSGTSIAQVTAGDSDRDSPNKDIEYSLEGSDSIPFFIDDRGTIFVNGSLDYEKETVHSIEVVAKDRGLPQYSHVALLIIDILDVNDNAPSFDSDPVLLAVPEGMPPGSTVGAVVAMDADGPGNNSNIQYFILADFTRGKFILLENGTVITTETFDREEQDTYDIIIRAIDQGNPQQMTEVQLVISILDSNEHTPVFQHLSYTGSVREDAPEGTPILQVTATDQDIDANGNIEYSILRNESNLFLINSTTGLIMAKELSYDFEMTERYELTVQAADQGTPSFSTTVPVEIHVLDVNDNPPVFLNVPYLGEIPENFAIGTTILQVTAMDADSTSNSIINYHLQNGFGSEYFGIDPVTGVLYTGGHLDHEVTPNLTLVVIATNPLGDVVLNSTVPISISVLDENDNHPTFDLLRYDVYIDENKVGGIFPIVTATDGDLGENGTIVYAIVSGNEENLFAINSTGGLLELQKAHDYEVNQTIYVLTVSATDRSVQQLTNYTTIYVHVNDLNDNPPVFPSEESFVSISSALTSGTTVAEIEFNDLDTVGDYMCSIISGNGDGLFSLRDQETCVVSTNSLLSGRLLENHTLTLQLSDGLHNTTHVITVHITGATPTHPVLLQSLYSVDIDENAVNTDLVTLEVLNADSFIIVSGNHLDHFSVSNSAIVRRISLGVLDYETTSSYLLSIQAINTATGEYAYVLVHVRVNDLNEFGPRFSNSHYFIAVPETTSLHSTLLHLPVQDLDRREEALQYELLETATPFTVDMTAGDLILSSDIDHDGGAESFNLTVEVVDADGYSDTTLITVVVLEENDNVPYFVLPRFTFNLLEDVNISHFVFQFTAADEDFGSNSEITFGLTGNHRYTDFQINSFSGALTVAQDLDQERQSSYELVIHLSDRGKSPQEATLTISIAVIDVNDNYPIWEESEYAISILENTSPGTSILKVRATDEDQIDLANVTGTIVYYVTNGLVSYSISSGNENGEFSIDNATGVVTIATALDRERQSLYNLTLLATDGGGLSTAANLTVVITDINDTPPMFPAATMVTNISEYTMNDTIVYEASANDYDETGPSSNFTYQIQFGNEDGLFSINPLSGQVILLGELDRETVPVYNLTLVAMDMGIPRLTGSAQLVIYINDENDNAPKFPNPYYSILIPENMGLEIPFLEVAAEDNDTDINGTILYHLLAKEMVTVETYINTTITVNCTNEFENITAINNTMEMENITMATYNMTLGLQNCTYEIIDSETRLEEKIILVPSLLFDINSTSGEILVISELDFETEQQHDVIVVAYDMAPLSSRLSATAEVTIFIEDINDNVPVFEYSLYEVTVYENSVLGTPVLTVQAVDEDQFDVLNYTIISSVPNSSLFSINGNGTLSTAGHIDRERDSLYDLVVMVADTATPPHTAITKVTIEILDRNDHIPQFTQPAYTSSIAENTASQIITELQATDDDIGSNAIVMYSIADVLQDQYQCQLQCSSLTVCDRLGNNSYSLNSSVYQSLFSLEESSGILSSNDSFDRENIDFYVLVVMTTDRGNPPFDPPLSSSACVAIEIIDINDNPPQFTSDNYEVSLEEQTLLLSAILILTATDPDTPALGETTFEIVSFTLGGDSFSLNLTGELHVISEVDREVAESINLTVVAENTAPPYLSASTLVTVFVEDRNDNSPQFPLATYQSQVLEDLPPGGEVTMLSARDDDSGQNALLRYSLIDNASLSHFTIDPITGNVTTLEGLDRETTEEYILVITATDGGLLPLSGSTVLIVTVLDVNDNAPIFSDPLYAAATDENVHNVELLTVNATDQDVGVNAQVSYSLVGMVPASNAFTVGEDTGIISLLTSLDSETSFLYTLTIQAYNPNAIPLQSSSVEVTITVLDTNDNPPIFESNVYQAAISEAAPLETQLIVIVATDDDISSSNSNIIYSIGNTTIPTGNTSNPFSVLSNGTLILSSNLDFENIKRYEFDLVAMDTGSPTLSASTQVIVYVQDHNDNTPVFSQPSYSFTVKENAPPQMIGQVTASDADISNQTFFIEETHNVTNFVIDSETGELFTIGSLDREMQSSYVINVTVEDVGVNGVTRYATVEVLIAIIDENDNSPLFESDMYGTSVFEDIPIPTPILNISALDLDTGSNGVVKYSLLPSNNALYFTINSTTGEISTNQNFDREVQDSFTIEVEATDEGDSPLSMVTAILILILDINDNNPVFVQPRYTSVIMENTMTGTGAAMLAATDRDIDENGQFYFSLTEGHFDSFAVDPMSGLITTSAPIDYEERPFYNITAVVRDMGNSSRSTSVQVEVEVIDLNDNPPIFDQPSYSRNITENSVLGALLFHIPATDEDSTSNGALRYTITSGNTGSHFALDEFTGDITVNTHLDREQESSYEMDLQVVDQGEPPFTATAKLFVGVLDENDNRPRFTQRIYHFSVNELRDGESVTVYGIDVVDKDIGPNSDVNFEIVSGNEDIFSINAAGDITATGPVFFESEQSFTISLRVQDSGDPMLDNTAIVNFVVVDSNLHPPLSKVTPIQINVPSNSPPGTTLLYLGANDEDTYRAGGLSFTMTSGDTTLFTVDSSTGTTSLVGSPSGREGSYNINVTVSDGALNSTIQVRVTIEPALNSIPHFAPIAMEIVTSELVAKDSILTTVSTVTNTGRVIVRFPTTPPYDTPPNSVYLMELSSMFEVQEDGTILIRNPELFDRERCDVILLPLEAYNEDSMETTLSLVTIRLEDGNDNPPIFDAPEYYGLLSEGVAMGTVVLSVSAYDLDHDQANIAVMYSVVGGNEEEKFAINNETGDIVIVSELDRELTEQFNLSIRATNYDSHLPLASDVTVVFEIYDENDNPPVLAEFIYHIELLENVTIGTEIFVVGVTDKDIGSNSEAVFYLTHQSVPGLFELDTFTGTLSTLKVLPPRDSPGYEVSIDVNDRGTPIPQAASAMIFIDVFSINYHPPIFDQSDYNFTISEVTMPPSIVLTPTATDADTNTSTGVTYSIVAGNSLGHFSIGATSGAIRVVTELDFLQQNIYSLVVMAMDNGKPERLSSTTTVNIQVEDVNNHVPVFDQSDYTVTVLENITIGTAVFNISATDPDAVLIYFQISLNSFDSETGMELFAIDRNTGVVTTQAKLDHERAVEHELIISAIDTGYPIQRSNSISARVFLTDLNDSPPSFTGDYTSIVYRRQQPGTVVAIVTAEDPDTVGMATQYSIQSGDTDGLFEINVTTGQVQTIREIPEVTSLSEFDLTILATDGELSSTAQLRIAVLSGGTYCEGDFCTTIQDRLRIRCPDDLVPSPDGELCLTYFCNSTNTYPCVTSRSCNLIGYACAGECPAGEAVCPTTDSCHPVSMTTTCDGSNLTCLLGQVLVENETGERYCERPNRLPSNGRSCTSVGYIYCTLLDDCFNLSAPHLCQHCPSDKYYCQHTDSCLSDPLLCCPPGETYCDALRVCLPTSVRCLLPNVAPLVDQHLVLVASMMSFVPDDIFSSMGHVTGHVISSSNDTAIDSQGEELGVAIVGVSDVPSDLGEWQYALCSDSESDSFGECSNLISKWKSVPKSVSDGNSFLLPPDSRIRFVRKSAHLEEAVWLSVKLWDGNTDGYLSSTKNLTHSHLPSYQSTIPFISSGAFSESTVLLVTLLHPYLTQPTFGKEGMSITFSSINEEERPIDNRGDIINEVTDGIGLLDLPPVDDTVIGGFPIPPDYVPIDHYQELLPAEEVELYLSTAEFVNQVRTAREKARKGGQDPGILLSFESPLDPAPGRWQISESGSIFEWRYLDTIIGTNDGVFLNLTARIRFLPNQDFHGNVSLLLHPWDGVVNANLTRTIIGRYIVTNLIESGINVTANQRVSLQVISVPDNPQFTASEYLLPPIPYVIKYQYERLFSVEFETSLGNLMEQASLDTLLFVALGTRVDIKRYLPTSDSSSIVWFSLDGDGMSVEVVRERVLGSTLRDIIADIRNVGNDGFYGPGAGCYGDSPQPMEIQGTQVQQVMSVVATDDDSRVLGMAIIGQSVPYPLQGVWQYFRSNYTDWLADTYHPSLLPWANLPLQVSETAALLLRPQDYIRFVPRPDIFWGNNSNQLPHLLIKGWDLSLWQPQNGASAEIDFYYVNTDPYADDIRAKVNPIGRFTDGSIRLTVMRYGCDGEVGSGLIHDTCCVCRGDGSSCSGCSQTEEGLSYDACGECGGEGVGCLGCDLIPFSTSSESHCEACLSMVSVLTSNLNSSSGYWSQSNLVDCSGACYGSALIDECGVCSEGISGHSYNIDKDCAGVCFGEAVVDGCGTCSNGTTGLQFNQALDCSGMCGGTFVQECGICYNPVSPSGPQVYRDCTGECFGEAEVDLCGICYCGSSDIQTPNTTLDACGVCGGDNSSCVGCDNVTGSGVVVDSCGTCGGNDCGCSHILSVIPTTGPATGGTHIVIKGAGFIINGSSFDPALPICGISLRDENERSYPLDCVLRSGIGEQVNGLAWITDQSTFNCLTGTITRDGFTENDFEIRIRVNNGPFLTSSPALLFHYDSYSSVAVHQVIPPDAPIGVSPSLTILGSNFINTSYVSCLIEGFDSCGFIDGYAEGRFLSSTELICLLPPSLKPCEVTITVTLDGQESGRVPQAPPTTYPFVYGTPPPKVQSVHFSENLKNLLVQFDGPVRHVDQESELDCGDIFILETIELFSASSSCQWTSIDQSELIVNLSSDAMVTSGSQIGFTDNIIVRKYGQLPIPICNLTVPVNGNVSQQIPIAVVVGPNEVPLCSGPMVFHGRNSLYPGYKDFNYYWSLHVVDSSVSGYAELVDYLQSRSPSSSLIELNADLFLSNTEYYLELIVENSQGTRSEPCRRILRRQEGVTSSNDGLASSLEVYISGFHNITISTNDSVFFTVDVTPPACHSTPPSYVYTWSLFEITDPVRSTLEAVTLPSHSLATLLLAHSTFTTGSNYVLVSTVTDHQSSLTGSDNVTIAVEPHPPVARIFGGAEQHVFADGTITLDGSMSSYDPYLGVPTFTWSCISVAKQPCYNESDPYNLIKIEEKTVIQIPAAILASTSFIFTFTITQGDLSSSALVNITVANSTSQAPLIVTTDALSVALATASLRIRGFVYSEVTLTTAQWTSVERYGYDHITLSEAVFTVQMGYNTQVDLVLPRGILKESRRYLFKLTAQSDSYSTFSINEVEVEPTLIVPDIILDQPTEGSLIPNVIITAIGSQSEDPSQHFRFGIRNSLNLSHVPETMWLSGEIPVNYLKTILPQAITEIELVAKVTSENNAEVEYSRLFNLLPNAVSPSVSTILDQYNKNGDWISSIAQGGVITFDALVSGSALSAEDTSALVNLLLGVASSESFLDTPTHNQVIATYLSLLSLQAGKVANEMLADRIVSFLRETLKKHTFEVDVPASSLLPTSQIETFLVVIETLQGKFPTIPKEAHPEAVDVIATGFCSVLSATDKTPDRKVSTDQVQLSVQKINLSNFPTSISVPCRWSEACSSLELSQDFISRVVQQSCHQGNGKTLPNCEEVCLQSSMETMVAVSNDSFVISQQSKIRIETEISSSLPDAVIPYSSISSFSVPILVSNGTQYANINSLTSPIEVVFPLTMELPSNKGQLICLHRQLGGGQNYNNVEWEWEGELGTLINDNTSIKCHYTHLTQFVVGLLPQSITPTSSLAITSSATPPTSSTMISSTPPLTATPTEASNVGVAAGISIVLVLIIIVIIILLIIFIAVWKHKRRGGAKIADADQGPSGEVADSSSVKAEDHRVVREVIALKEEGFRDVMGTVRVLPSVRLKEVRDILIGSFEDKLKSTPFYLITSDFKDIEPSAEPFRYFNVVYKGAIFIRIVTEHDETTRRHFCPCGKAAMFECTQCGSQGYCGPDCQLEHWIGDHNKECKRLAEKKRRQEVLERRPSASQTEPSTPQAVRPSLPSRAAARDWREFMSGRHAIRPSTVLTTIEEVPTKSSLGRDIVDASKSTPDGTAQLPHYRRDSLIMKPPPLAHDPFARPGTRPSVPTTPVTRPSVPATPVTRPSVPATPGTRPSVPTTPVTLPPVKPPIGRIQSPPTASPPLVEPSKPPSTPDKASYYWNRFPATSRPAQPQLVPLHSKQPTPKPAFIQSRQQTRDFIPPQPLEEEASIPGTPAGPSSPITMATATMETPIFQKPPIGFSTPQRPPLTGHMSIRSIQSVDLESSLDRPAPSRDTRTLPHLHSQLEEAESESGSSSDSITSSSSVSSSESDPESEQ